MAGVLAKRKCRANCETTAATHVITAASSAAEAAVDAAVAAGIKNAFASDIDPIYDKEPRTRHDARRCLRE